MSKFASLSVSLREGRRFSDPINRNRFSFVGLMPVQEILKFQPGQIPWVNPRNPNPKLTRRARLWPPSSKIGENSIS